METGVTKKVPPTKGTHVERVKRARGAGKSEPPASDLLTPDEMLDVLRSEVIAISRGAHMQIAGLTAIVTDYARGKISAEEANERYHEHTRPWTDPLYGISTFEGRSDRAILEEMERVKREVLDSDTERRARLEEYEKNRGRSR
jgi:hypothetical protein